MIIAGYAGTGKSAFAAQIENAIDLTTMLFSRILPTDECKEEYRRRFADRGNSDEFIEVFIGKWEEILLNVRELDNVEHIPLGPGEYLTDVREKLDSERAADTTQPVPEQVVEQLEKEVCEGGKGYVLYISGWEDVCFYRIPGLYDPAERDFLYRVGRELWMFPDRGGGVHLRGDSPQAQATSRFCRPRVAGEISGA